jgi:hypothetical protein
MQQCSKGGWGVLIAEDDGVLILDTEAEAVMQAKVWTMSQQQ